MSINLRNISVLLPLSLLLSIVAEAATDAFGQDTPSPNITSSDIVDLFSNVTDREERQGGEGDDDRSNNFPQPNDGGNNISTSSSASMFSSSPPSSSSPSLTTGQTIMINEIELNPPGEYDEGKEWIELYNPSDDEDINISNFEISTSSESATIKLPPDAIIEAGETYVIELEQQILSNTVDSLVLTDQTGDIILDRTPSLVDRSDDERTWQRIPDGNNEWQFVEGTEGNANGDDDDGDDPDTLNRLLDSAYSESEVLECLGSADCIEGVATRIVDGDTLYVRANSTVYKVDLAIIEAPSRSEEGFVESTAFTRDLCLGSTVLVDQDDMLLTSADSNIIAVVHCSSSNLNEELLDNGYAELDVQQCATSEFANEPWVKDYGC